MTRRNHHPIPVQEPPLVHKPSLFSISRLSTPTHTQEQRPGSSSRGPGHVEWWIKDQIGEDQDPHRSSPMPRHSDTIIHSRRLTPVKPRTPVSPKDASDFVFVDDDDEEMANGTGRNQTPPPHGGRTSGLFGNGSSPLKNWRMSFTSSTRRGSTGSHNRGSSFPSFSTSSPNTPEKSDGTKRSTSPWKAKFQRPSVVGHFGSITESEAVKSRPSFGSTDSYPPSRPSLDATGSLITMGTQNSVLSSSGFAKSSQSLWSIPPSATHIHDPPGSTKLVSQPSKSTIRVPFSLKPSVYNPSGRPPSLIAGARRKSRRKRLVIGGIPLNDHRRYEAAKRWCESFGEVASITRGTNGEILVDFRKAEVADTVCRVQARVCIAGVGSCYLSWHTVK